jgi:hypothetical protein
MNKTRLLSAIFVMHVAVFVAMYYGRTRNIDILQSDILLFLLPAVAATIAYAHCYNGILHNKPRPISQSASWGAALLSSAGSLLTGMAIAFNVWGT